MFYRVVKRYLNVEEFNSQLEFCKICRNIIYSKYEQGMPLGPKAYINDKEVFIELTYRTIEGPCTYIARKDEAPNIKQVSGTDAWTILGHYYKVPKAEAPFSASPLLWKNDNYDGTRNYAYEYDRNSAYSYVLRNCQFPDTSVPTRTGTVRKGEVGFNIMGDIIYKGAASFIFPLMDSPFTKFVDHWSDLKIKAERDGDIEYRQKCKDVMNFVVGYFQRKNPFLRAFVVNTCNNQIKQLIDSDTLYCNTDAIVSLKKLDLPLSDQLGDWKLHEGEFAFKGFNYQWDRNIPSVRHVPKAWFKEGYDILTDPYPVSNNFYKLDKEILKLVEVNKDGKNKC